MPKKYDIKNTIKNEKGVITDIITQGGTVKSKQEVINDLNNGYSVTSGGTPVVTVNDEYVRTVPNGKDSDNLSNK